MSTDIVLFAWFRKESAFPTASQGFSNNIFLNLIWLLYNGKIDQYKACKPQQVLWYNGSLFSVRFMTTLDIDFINLV